MPFVFKRLALILSITAAFAADKDASFKAAPASSYPHHQTSEAITDAPTRAEAQCVLAEGLRVNGDLQGALDAYQSCLRIARAASDQLSTARALHGVASTYERMPDHLTDARAAWMEYTHFADGAARVAPGTIGRERVSTIDVAGEQERVYVDVRARIADRQRIAREAAAAPPPPPPPSRGRR